MEIDILKCELTKLVHLYSSRIQWGIDCDIDKLYNRALVIRNQIAILENLCPVSPSILRHITIDVNKIQNSNSINLCTNC
jgi:hypothetical protein